MGIPSKINNKGKEVQNIEPSALIDNVDEEKSNDGVQALEKDKKTEEYRLGGRSPLVTILILMIGPLTSQILLSMYGLVDSFWISKTIGKKGLTTMSLVSTIDFVDIAIRQFLCCAMSTRISYLIGLGQKEKCAQVVVDLFRIEIALGMLVPAILIPCVKPMVRWYGGDEEVSEMALDYLLPSLCCSIIKYSYFSLCGLLQAMGNTLVFGLLQAVSVMLNMLVFDPMLLLGFKMGMAGVSVAQVLSSLIPFIVLYSLLFAGKFCVKPSFSLYLNKFSPDSFDALRVSTSQLIANLATATPDLFFTKLIGQASKPIGCYVETMASWNVLVRLDEFAMCVCSGLNQGFLPAAAYAFGKGDLYRLSRMALITMGIGTGWTSLCCILITTIPRQIASIWGNDEKFLDICSKFLVICFASCFLTQIILTTTALLQAIKMVLLSIITSILTMLIPVPLFGIILYMTDKTNPVRLIFAYIAQDIWSILVTITVLVWKLRFLFTTKKNYEEKNNITTDSKQNQNTDNVNKDPENGTIMFEDKISKDETPKESSEDCSLSDVSVSSDQIESEPLLDNAEP